MSFMGYCDRRTTTPPFMTNDTLRVADMSAAGSPATAMRSASRPGANPADLCLHFHDARVD
jgi:hypothetical protein